MTHIPALDARDAMETHVAALEAKLQNISAVLGEVATGNGSGNGHGNGTAAEATDELDPDMEGQLHMAEQKAQNHWDSWISAKAELENVRKRSKVDLEAERKFAIEGLAAALLPVRDSLEAALASGAVSPQSLHDGVALTLRQLNAVFAQANLSEVNPVNEKFDPHKHHAVTLVAHPGQPDHVVEVMQKGYLLHERLIRPALVTVSTTVKV